jgi:hypothetical protein
LLNQASPVLATCQTSPVRPPRTPDTYHASEERTISRRLVISRERRLGYVLWGSFRAMASVESEQRVVGETEHVGR